ncbi:hypothetical protein COLSTE_00384 [Collinsella stercoris DSM 13279]|uniref:Uncharacterized protein n=1 Tax=Collinsella stercoris DSM 13279 TaxID=445975 RepID=B6G8J3_9ACTN|nr:hypothetical protein COLSTE_00384 [Collinsella stercoris DSM 13279]
MRPPATCGFSYRHFRPTREFLISIRKTSRSAARISESARRQRCFGTK